MTSIDATSPSAQTNPDRERLKVFFGNLADADIPRRWDDLWKEGTCLPFDRKTPNPALDEALQSHVSFTSPPPKDRLLGTPIAGNRSPNLDRDQTERKWALVPGCGRGYDVLLLQAYGYNAVGLEISETAVKEAYEMKRLKEAASVDGKEGLTKEHLGQYTIRNSEVSSGTASFIAGDFFSSEWSQFQGGVRLPEKWDLIYDYTFLSALPPGLRPKWAARMRDLLKPEGGRLVCVEFPTYKEPKTGGPPWALPSVVYEAHLGRPGTEIAYDEDGHVVLSDEDRLKVGRAEPLVLDGLVRLAHWKANKTHEIGKGTDHIGVWKLALGL